MPRPIDSRTARKLRSDAAVVARLRTALALDPGIDAKAAGDVIEACDTLMTALRKLIIVTEEAEETSGNQTA